MPETRTPTPLHYYYCKILHTHTGCGKRGEQRITGGPGVCSKPLTTAPEGGRKVYTPSRYGRTVHGRTDESSPTEIARRRERLACGA
jgi:hypothetical protein